MILILEGSDGVGKTTLGKYLMKVYKNSIYIHNSY
jgi:thymidylate kinase